MTQISLKLGRRSVMSISATLVLRAELGISLATAKSLLDDVVAGGTVEVDVPSSILPSLSAALESMGLAVSAPKPSDDDSEP